jgi:uncharacterized protein (DUF885 family)
VRDPELASLCVDLWEEMLRADPVSASRNGDARYLGLLPELGEASRRARGQRLAALEQRAAAIDAQALAPDERITLAMAREELSRERTLHDAHLDRWLVDPANGVQTMLFNLAPDQPASTEAERAALRQRWAAMPAYVDQVRRALEEGLADGLVSSRTALQTSLEQLERLLAQDVADWPLANPDLESLEPEAAEAFRAGLREGLEQDLRPAFTHLRDTLERELLPAARSDDAPGLASLPGGPALYRELVRLHVGLDLSPEEIHRRGLAEVARIRGEMSTLGERVLGTSEVAQIQARLRSDPALHFTTRDEVEAAARRALERAQASLDGWFGRQPRTPCTVVRIAPHEELDTTIAYYFPPAADGSRPGRSFINTSEPTTRPRYDAAALAYHESVPGHHLQIALAQELEGLPRVQREAGSTAFVEGWALYAERLADEMGLYDGDLDRLGMLSFDAWRASRLVVDTGLHALGWSRQRAIDYLADNTLLSANNVANEIDRYIANPGQALAYKLGQLEILRLRQEAEQALGADFSIAAFHDVVLSAGALTLPVLRQRVETWIAAGG